MNFDGILFKKVVELVKPTLLQATINRVVQISASDFSFSLYKNNELISLFVSTNPNLAHFNLHSKRYNSSQPNSAFLDMLKLHLEGAEISNITAIENERIFKLTAHKINEIGAQITRFLYVELTGKRTNMILAKDDNTILDALTKLSYDETTKRMIARGMMYHLPEKNATFGLSSLLEKERLERGWTMEQIRDFALSSHDLYVYDNYFHLIELTYLHESVKIEPILAGIYNFYENVIQKNALNEAQKPILKTIKNEKNRLIKRLALLDDALINAQDASRYKKFGDLIFTYATDLHLKQTEIVVIDEENNLEVTIPLDERYDVKYNANRYYLKYKKLQTSIEYSQIQRKLCLEELEYFDTIALQLENELSSYDLEQIRQELIQLHYLDSHEKVKKNIKPKIVITKYVSRDGTAIYVGKNNIQNNYLTFEFAKPLDTFFHVKDFPGAHVIVQGNELSEQTIRLAAKIAAYYSKARHSSSIPIDYTQISNVKKISGSKMGKVMIKKQKTIYIDIDEDLSVYLVNRN